MDTDFSVRAATAPDIPAPRQLIEQSVRVLQAGDDRPAPIDGALDSVFGVDTHLVEDGTYFVVESGGSIAGCGGWSKRKTLCGGDQWVDRKDSL